MTKTFITACIAITLFCRCSEKKGLSNILPNCYWDILDKGSPHPINSCYKFSKAGDCNFYYYHFFNKKKMDSVYLFDDDDVVVPHTWTILYDSIQIRANKYKVIKFSPDSVFLTATGKDTMVLKKNCSTYSQKNR